MDMVGLCVREHEIAQATVGRGNIEGNTKNTCYNLKAFVLHGGVFFKVDITVCFQKSKGFLQICSKIN